MQVLLPSYLGVLIVPVDILLTVYLFNNLATKAYLLSTRKPLVYLESNLYVRRLLKVFPNTHPSIYKCFHKTSTIPDMTNVQYPYERKQDIKLIIIKYCMLPSNTAVHSFMWLFLDI